ncbi:MAG: hypothetical protein ACOC1F_14240, partial [Myxococcota bacterium]
SSLAHLLGVTLIGGAVLFGSRGPSPRDAERLAMAAQASGRPKECRGQADGARQRRLTIWDRAKQPHLHRYCDLLGRAQAKLDGSPAAAREAARLADQVLPGMAAPRVIIGRAYVRLRDFDQALRYFHKARKLDARSIEDPPSLHDLALAQRHAGKLPEAMATYRVLVPRLGLMPAADDRVAVLAEAAALAMARGKAGLDEALALLQEARAQPLSKHDPIVLGLLALALDRAGAQQEAEAVLDELHRANLAGELVSRRTPSEMLAYPGDWDAIVGLVLETTDPAGALAAWKRYAEATPAPVFAEHAATHIDKLRRTAPGARYRPR